MPTKTKDQLLTENGQLLDTIELFSERLAELELALEDTDWIRLSLEGSTEFTNTGLSKIITLARLAFLKNPLINRAVNVGAFYVWGQGVNLEAHPKEVDAVVQAFLDHPKNRAELTSHQARTLKEVELETAANVFLVLFTNSSTGRVVVRSIPVDEILAGDIITNPEDRREPWYYLRAWSQRTFNQETGESLPEQHKAYYPDWQYRPPTAERPDAIGGHPVHWDQPVLHVKVGGIDGMRFGVPEVYSALDWAKAVTKDLERYATLRAALARYAHKITTEGGPDAVKAAKAKLGTTLGSAGGSAAETNPPPIVGSTFVANPGTKLEAYNTRNAAPAPDDGRRLGLMVAAGTGIPETILFGDADVGNLATAKTLDRPTELKVLDRQTLWIDVHKAILGYVVEQAARRANGPLEGVVQVEEDADDPAIVRLTVAAPQHNRRGPGADDGSAADGEERRVPVGFDVTFPAILERSVTERVEAIVKATTLGNSQGTPAGTIDPRTAMGLLLGALGLDDVDELLDELAPEGTTWEDLRPTPEPAPAPPAGGQPGQPGQPGSDGQPGPDGQPSPDDQVAEALREVRAAAAAVVEELAQRRAPTAA